MGHFVARKIRTALDNVLDHCSADGADIDLIEDFVLTKLNSNQDEQIPYELQVEKAILQQHINWNQIKEV